MDIPEDIFKSYDIRGVYPDQLNEQNAIVIATAIYKFFQEKINKDQVKILVSRDMRLSSPAITKSVIKTFVDLGGHVVDSGINSTPTFYYGVSNLGFDAGIQITASHNPKDYNGMKFVISTKKGIIKIGKSTGMDQIKKLSLEAVSKGHLDIEKSGSGKQEKIDNLVEGEVKNAFKIAVEGEVKKYKIVADPANAMGAIYLEELFKIVPAELIKMNFELDGNFPAHLADPLVPENIVDLKKRVIKEGADLGLAPDGDGDRIMFIDERGELVSPSVITAMVASKLLKSNPGGKVLFDIRYVLTPKRIVEEYGGESFITKVGHAFITESMQKEGGIFAGESSGHYYFKATGGAESAVSVIIIVLQLLSESGKKLSELAKDFVRSQESGEINFKVKNAKEIIEVVKQKYSDGEISELDGVAVDYPNWRFSIRTSNTEPLLRLNVEEEIVGASGRHQELVELINKHAQVDESSGH